MKLPNINAAHRAIAGLIRDGHLCLIDHASLLTMLKAHVKLSTSTVEKIDEVLKRLSSEGPDDYETYNVDGIQDLNDDIANDVEKL